LPGYERGRDLPPGIIPAIPFEVRTSAIAKRREAKRASEAQTAARSRKGAQPLARLQRPKGRKRP
jgi:hypothetical protein